MLKEQGQFIDVEGDGNCGYHSLVLASWMNNLDAKSESYKEIINDDDPSIKLRKELYNHALRPNVMRRILESHESLRKNVEIFDSTLPKNLHSTLRKKIAETRKVAKGDPKNDGVNDNGTGVDLLGNLIYRI